MLLSLNDYININMLLSLHFTTRLSVHTEKTSLSVPLCRSAFRASHQFPLSYFQSRSIHTNPNTLIPYRLHRAASLLSLDLIPHFSKIWFLTRTNGRVSLKHHSVVALLFLFSVLLTTLLTQEEPSLLPNTNL